MKSVIIFYIPYIMGETDAVKAERDEIDNRLHELRRTNLGQNFHIVIVEDPDRTKIEAEVFFKPE